MLRHDLSVPGREPRAALDVDFESSGYRMQLVATHLGLCPAERRAQVRRLIPLFHVEGRHLVVAGDLNEWFLWSRPLRLLHRIFPDTPYRRTWQAWAPLLSLDRIWVHPLQGLGRLTVQHSKLTRIASDHLPVVAGISAWT